MINQILSFSPWFFFTVLPLIYLPFLSEPFEYPKVILFIFAVYFLIGLFCWQILTGKIKKVKFNCVHYLVLLFFSIILFSSTINGLGKQSLFGQYYRYQGLLTSAGYLLFVFLFSQAESFGLKPQSLKRPILWGGIVTATIIISQSLLLKVFHLPIINLNGRLAGHLGNPNFAAGFLAIAWVYVFKPKQWFLGLIFLLAIFLTASRSGLIAFAVGNTFLVASVFRGKKLFYLGAIILASALLLVIIWRPTSTFENQPLIWQKAIEAFSRKPIFGWGVENFESAFRSVLKPTDFDLKNVRVDRAHNEFLEVGIASGLVGLAGYFWLIVESIKKLWLRRKDDWAKANLIALITYLALAQFNVLNLNEYLFFYFVLANAAASEKLKKN